MGIYQGTNRIDSVNVGSKDMVCVMQDNHILALGGKYWAVDLGSLNWAYSSDTFVSEEITNIIAGQSGEKPNIYCAKYNVGNTGAIVEKEITISTGKKVWIVDGDFDNTTDFKNAMSEVWLIYEFNQTLYAKVDLGSLSYEKLDTYKTFRTEPLENIKAPDNDGVVANVYTLSLNTDSVANGIIGMVDNVIAISNTGRLYIRITNAYYDTYGPSAFKRKMTGKELLYEVAE